MSQKHFVIIGGSKGIGFEIVQQLIANGEAVTVVSRNKDLLVSNTETNHITKDIVIDELDASELPETIDGLVYCPGSIVLKPFKSISHEQFMEDFTINCLGAVKSIKAALPGLKKSANIPGIVLFSTVAVTQGMPFHASIAAAKGALEGLTRSLAAEFAPSIRVNCIAPSLTNTDLAAKMLSSDDKIQAAAQRHPLKAIGNPRDIAALASFLLSDQAKWISGQIMHVDGGMSSLRV